MRVFYGVLWGLLILSVMRTTILIRRRDTSEFSAVDGSALLAIVIVGLLFGAILIAPRTRWVLAQIRRSSPTILLVYLAMAVVSASWSLMPSFTLFRALEVTAIFVTCFILASRQTDFFIAERSMLRMVMIVTVLAFFFRALNVGWSIEALHTNTYTVTGGMGFLYTLGESFQSAGRRRRILRWWAIVFLVFLMVGTSVGSNISTAFGFLIMLTLMGFGRFVILPALVLGGLTLTWIGAIDTLLTETIFAGRSTAELANLTGRDHLWTAYFNGFLDSPLVGYGFAVGARVGSLFGTVDTTNTHNGFIEAVLGIGLIGISLLLYYFYRLFKELVFARQMHRIGSIGMISAMAMMMLNNNSKSLVGGAYDPTLVGIFSMIAFSHYAIYRPARHWHRHSTVSRVEPADRVRVARA